MEKILTMEDVTALRQADRVDIAAQFISGNGSCDLNSTITCTLFSEPSAVWNFPPAKRVIHIESQIAEVDPGTKVVCMASFFRENDLIWETFSRQFDTGDRLIAIWGNGHPARGEDFVADVLTIQLLRHGYEPVAEGIIRVWTGKFSSKNRMCRRVPTHPAAWEDTNEDDED